MTTEPFDQSLFDLLMADPKSTDRSARINYGLRREAYDAGYKAAAANAARIVAERAASAPTDEALADLYEDAYVEESEKWPDGRVRPGQTQACHMAAIRAVRAALRPGPVIPALRDIPADIHFEIHRQDNGDWAAFHVDSLGHDVEDFTASGPIEALIAAIAEAAQ